MTLELKNICVFKGSQPLFDPVTLVIEQGETAVVMGPSGCGKSTLLAAVSGSLDDEFKMKGDIVLCGKSIACLPMENRNIGILFQDDLLFPHMNIGANLAFALPDSVSAFAVKKMVASALETAGLTGYENRDPATLSGGQKARVSLLRTLMAQPAALLLDEPFSKLDQDLRDQIRSFVFTQVEKMKIPALLVTHDRGDCPVNGRILYLDKKEGYDA